MSWPVKQRIVWFIVGNHFHRKRIDNFSPHWTWIERHDCPGHPKPTNPLSDSELGLETELGRAADTTHVNAPRTRSSWELKRRSGAQHLNCCFYFSAPKEILIFEHGDWGVGQPRGGYLWDACLDYLGALDTNKMFQVKWNFILGSFLFVCSTDVDSFAFGARQGSWRSFQAPQSSTRHHHRHWVFSPLVGLSMKQRVRS